MDNRDADPSSRNERIDNVNQKILDEIIVKVLELQDAWVSDLSSITDFDMGDNPDEFQEKITEQVKMLFGVDISAVFNEKLYKIIDYIDARTKHR